MEIINTIESPLSEVERKITHLEDFVDTHRNDKEIQLQVFFKIDNMVSSIEHQAVESIGFNGLNMDNKSPDYTLFDRIAQQCALIHSSLRANVFDQFLSPAWIVSPKLWDSIWHITQTMRRYIFEYRNRSTAYPS